MGEIREIFKLIQEYSLELFIFLAFFVLVLVVPFIMESNNSREKQCSGNQMVIICPGDDFGRCRVLR